MKWYFLFSGNNKRLGGAELSMSHLAQSLDEVYYSFLRAPKTFTGAKLIPFSLLVKSEYYQFFGLRALLFSFVMPHCNSNNRFVAIRGEDNFRSTRNTLIYRCLKPWIKGWISNSISAIDVWDSRGEIRKSDSFLVRNFVDIHVEELKSQPLYRKDRIIVVANEKAGKGLEKLCKFQDKLRGLGLDLEIDVFGVRNYSVFPIDFKEEKSKIYLKGWLDNIHEVMIHYDLMLSLSDSEGLPHSMLVARQMGLPIFSLKAGDIGCLVKNGSNGYVRENIHELVMDIFAFYNDRILLDSENACDEFSREVIVKFWTRFQV
jgi:glycosyltransferase involved in cell wall biosynthesis